jgi:Na+/H+ antiporter NhaD/arsenite permease-like protein
LVASGFVAAAQGLPVSPAAVALLAAAVLMIWDRRDGVSRALADIDGPVLMFYGGLFAVVAALGASGLPAAFARNFVPSGPVLLAGSALLGALVDHGAVLGATIPFLKSWVLGGPGSLWVYAVMGTTIGAGITVWGSASVATALGLAGSGRHTPDWKQFTVYGLVFGAVNLLVVGILGALLLR